MTELKASGLTVERGSKRILDNASLTGAGGEFIAVIGANGSGKSTLLSSITGFLKPDTGNVSLNGRELKNYGGFELARLRAYLPQSPRCEWPISVERLVALGLTPSLPAIGGLPASDRARIAEVLDMCDLASHRDQAATTLSGGELARAMLARALVCNPRVLIADEPIAGLDPRHALDTMRRLRKLAEAGALVIASLHDLTLAMRYATHVVALHEGRIVANGPIGKVLTPELLRNIFQVEARISGAGDTAFVDFLGPL